LVAVEAMRKPLALKDRAPFRDRVLLILRGICPPSHDRFLAGDLKRTLASRPEQVLWFTDQYVPGAREGDGRVRRRFGFDLEVDVMLFFQGEHVCGEVVVVDPLHDNHGRALFLVIVTRCKRVAVGADLCFNVLRAGLLFRIMRVVKYDYVTTKPRALA
jgi:hypothetical protein